MLLRKDGHGNIIQGVAELGTCHSAAMSTVASAVSTTIAAGILRVCATQDCFFTLGDTIATATTSNFFLPAGVVEYIGTSGEAALSAIMTSTATGTFYATEVKG